MLASAMHRPPLALPALLRSSFSQPPYTLLRTAPRRLAVQAQRSCPSTSLLSTSCFSSPARLRRTGTAWSASAAALPASLSPLGQPAACSVLAAVSHRSFQSSRVRLTVHGDPETDPAGRVGSLLRSWESWRPRVVSYLWLAGGLLCCLLILRAGLWLVAFFSRLDFADVSEVAFVAGLLTGLGLLLVFTLGRRALTLSPEAVYRDALSQVVNDPTVRSHLGDKVSSGAFRAYSFLPAAIRWPALTQPSSSSSSSDPAPSPPSSPSTPSLLSRVRSYWRPRRVQVFFQVTGTESRHAMVSAEVEKLRGSQRYTLLCIDVLDSGQRVVLQGDPHYQIYQGLIKLR